MKHVIAFRVDSGEKIGSGHVMRCLALARALKSRGVNSVFVCRPNTGSVEDQISAEGFTICRLPEASGTSNASIGLMHGDFLSCSQGEDALATIESLRPHPDVNLMIVDHYGIYKPWDEILSDKFQIYKIDDLADRAHLCAGLLDQNYYSGMKTRYAGLIPNSCNLLVGPQYAILRPQFQDLSISDRRARASVKHVLVTFGGQDSHGYSLQVAKDLLQNTQFDVTVMGAPASINKLDWQQLNSKYNQRLSGPTYFSDPLSIFLNADIYVGAGGTTTWERFASGLPGIVFSIAKNQVQMALDLEKAGFQAYGGDITSYSWEKLSMELSKLENPAHRWKLSAMLRDQVDGHGVEEVISAWRLAGD